jgi:hypothetical protein
MTRLYAIGAICIFCNLLAACASTPPEPKIVVKEVSVPVAVPCKPTITLTPAPDSDAAILATHEPGELLLLLAAGRLVREGWVNELQAAVKGCGGQIQ